VTWHLPSLSQDSQLDIAPVTGCSREMDEGGSDGLGPEDSQGLAVELPRGGDLALLIFLSFLFFAAVTVRDMTRER